CDHVDVVENGIEPQFYASVGGARDPRRLLFLGSLEWRPNLDAITMLLDRVLPAVRAREPATTVSIVGRNPPRALAQRVRETAGVDLHANVPDVRPYLGQSGLMVVPLRIAGGSRLKILEALAIGLPVVSTRIGAEGLRLRAGEHLSVAEDVD